MSDYLPHIESIKTKSALLSTIGQKGVKNTHANQNVRLLDTIIRAEQNALNIEILPGDRRLELPIPHKNKVSQNDLMILAEAFIKAFTAMDNSVITGTKNYAEMQQLDQAQASAILQSTTNAINKQKMEFKLYEQAESYANKEAHEEAIFSYTMMGLGGLLILATVVSAIVSCGATLAATPEVAAFIAQAGTDATVSTSEDVGMEMSDMASISDSTEGSSGDEDTVSTEEGSTAPTKTEASLDNQIEEQTEKTTTKELDQNDQANEKSATKKKKLWRDTIIKKATQIVGFTVFSSPLLWKGIAGINVYHKLNDVKDAQKQVGQAVDTMQQNDMYFRFLQQLVQRSGGVLREEASNASEVVETYAAITNAYRGISYGLANAV